MKKNDIPRIFNKKIRKAKKRKSNYLHLGKVNLSNCFRIAKCKAKLILTRLKNNEQNIVNKKK